MLCDGKPLNVGAFASRHLRLSAYETRAIAFSKMKDNLINSALFPLLPLPTKALSVLSPTGRALGTSFLDCGFP
jgi:hypothetical protein